MTLAELHTATKRYGSFTALSDLNLSVRRGEVVALLGANGAGKTTAAQLLLGLTPPSSGSVRVLGGDPVDPLVRRRIGAMLQVQRIPETLRVRELVSLFSSYYPAPFPSSRITDMTGLQKLVQKTVGSLSGGQRQRVFFALAICGNPALLVLDEPAVGLDVESRRLLWAAVRELVRAGTGVLLTTHYLEEADALADRIVVLNRGRVTAEGSPLEIKQHSGTRRIRCSTTVPAGTLKRIAGVSRVEQFNLVTEVITTDVEPVLRQMLALDDGLSHLEVTGANLEEAIVSLTR